MFTRSRSGGNQNFSGRNNMMNSSSPFPPGNNSYNQQGNYQPNNAFKPSGISMNEPFKPSAGPMMPQQQQQQGHQQQGHQQQPQGHQQQQKGHQQQGNQQQPPPQQQQQQQNVQNPQQTQGLQPPRLKPILKTAPVPPVTTPPEPSAPPAPVPATEPDDTSSAKDEDMPLEGTDLPRWKRNKVAGAKVNRKLKRLRMNQRLRKTLMPKNAIMVLNEMKAGVQFTFPETQSVPNSLFLVHANLDGKTYVGQGLSKLLARQNAAENALKSLLLEKMTAAALKAKVDEELEGKELNQSKADSETDGSMMETSNGDEADDVPWSSLASFALHKLFLEWQNSGTVVPIPRPGVQQPIKQKAEPKIPTEKKLPANPELVHPVMLLNQMRPGTTYVEVSRVGNPPNTLFTLSVSIDDRAFTGAAKNKKDAKKLAAKAALEGLYGLQYPAENNEEANQGQSMEADEQIQKPE